MNKFTAFAIALLPALAAWAVPADYQWPTEMITEQPAGDYSQTYVSSQITWLLYNNQSPATINGNYGVERHMVVNGNDVYLENFLLEKNTGSWIHGTVQENGDVVFAFPQKIYQDSHYTWYLGTLTPTLTDGTINMELIPENCNMTMRWVDGVLTQVLPSTEGIENEQMARLTGMVGAVNQDGAFLAFGEKGLTVRTWTEQPLQAPEFTSTEAYELTYIDRDNAEVHTQLALGFINDEVWIQGINRWIPEAWIKGTVTETGWEFSMPQYMGNYLGFYTFAMGATGNISDGFTPKDKITFTKTESGSLLSSDVLCVNISTEKLDPSLVFSDMEFTPMSAVVQTPPAPDSFEVEWDSNDGMGIVYFVLPSTDTEGRPLDMSKLFYNVYYNDQLYTFTPDNDFVEEEMTDVPALYSNDFTILHTGDGGVMLVVLVPYQTVGVRCVYKNASETTYSEIMTFPLNSGLALETADSPMVSETYFSTKGRPVVMPAPGNIYIVRRVYANGKVKVAKVTM